MKKSLTGLSIALFLFMSQGKDARAQNMMELEVSGPPGAAFEGDCRLTSRFGTEKRHRLKGKAPAKFWLPAQAARCSFYLKDARGNIAASFSNGGKMQIRTTSQLPLRWLSIASVGPWGNAKGAATASRPLWQ
ncbi:MAG: hypothetical protein NXI13_06080 [Proteobacteria bacterium]|nr:hypothetical protein [Pseudomonadota bacterium]